MIVQLTLLTLIGEMDEYDDVTYSSISCSKSIDYVYSSDKVHWLTEHGAVIKQIEYCEYDSYRKRIIVFTEVDEDIATLYLLKF